LWHRTEGITVGEQTVHSTVRQPYGQPKRTVALGLWVDVGKKLQVLAHKKHLHQFLMHNLESLNGLARSQIHQAKDDGGVNPRLE
jgi:hypothetical protein